MSTLHRSNSLRRQYVNQAGLKRKSQSMSVKYQMVRYKVWNLLILTNKLCTSQFTNWSME